MCTMPQFSCKVSVRSSSVSTNCSAKPDRSITAAVLSSKEASARNSQPQPRSFEDAVRRATKRLLFPISATRQQLQSGREDRQSALFQRRNPALEQRTRELETPQYRDSEPCKTCCGTVANTRSGPSHGGALRYNKEKVDKDEAEVLFRQKMLEPFNKHGRLDVDASIGELLSRSEKNIKNTVPT